jgi:hypothetical protein
MTAEQRHRRPLSPTQEKVLSALVGDMGPSELSRRLEAVGVQLALPNISRYLAGKRPADPRFLYGLSRVFNVDLARLSAEVLGVEPPDASKDVMSSRTPVPTDDPARAYLTSLLRRLNDEQVELLISAIIEGSLQKWLNPAREPEPPYEK